MMASVVGLTLKPDALWMPDPAATVPLMPEALHSFQEVVKAFATDLDAALGMTYGSARVSKVGQVHGRVMMRRQHIVDLFLPETIDHNGLDRDRWIAPMVEAMKNEIGWYRPQAFGQLPIDVSGILRGYTVRTDSGLCVRGLQQYDPTFDHILTRLDVIYG